MPHEIDGHGKARCERLQVTGDRRAFGNVAGDDERVACGAHDPCTELHVLARFDEVEMHIGRPSESFDL